MRGQSSSFSNTVTVAGRGSERERASIPDPPMGVDVFWRMGAVLISCLSQAKFLENVVCGYCWSMWSCVALAGNSGFLQGWHKVSGMCVELGRWGVLQSCWAPLQTCCFLCISRNEDRTLEYQPLSWSLIKLWVQPLIRPAVENLITLVVMVYCNRVTCPFPVCWSLSLYPHRLEGPDSYF